jgi:Gpi18-like mannosyltransferase
MQNKKTKNTKIVKFFNIIFYTIIFIYFAFLVRLIDPQRHVDPDFFQFLRDSNFYLKFQLPPTIQSLPANPILIGVFSKILSAFLTEIEVALLINAIAMTAAILLVYFILKKERDVLHAGLAILFLISNPIVFKSAVSNNSEVLFSMFSLFIFFLVWKRKIFLASFLTALGILIRYESILLFISLILIDFLNKRNLVNLIKKIIVFFIPAALILTVLMTRNYSKSLLNTPFLIELFQRSEDIPELRFISNFPFTFFYNENYLYAKPNLIIILISIIFYLLIFFLQKYNFNKNKNNNLIKTTLLFSGLFLVFHTLFPAYLERYFTPVIFSFVLSTPLL